MPPRARVQDAAEDSAPKASQAKINRVFQQDQTTVIARATAVDYPWHLRLFLCSEKHESVESMSAVGEENADCLAASVLHADCRFLFGWKILLIVLVTFTAFYSTFKVGQRLY